ncbi:MAG: monovalent cation/H(+) antiporter subunit G [Solirubrobacterales bacterium]
MSDSARLWLGDGLALLGLMVITLGVVGFVRMPDLYNKLHASSKTVFLGVVALLGAAALGVGLEAVAPALLTAGFVLLTTPVSAHAIAHAARVRGSEDIEVHHAALDGDARADRGPGSAP